MKIYKSDADCHPTVSGNSAQIREQLHHHHMVQDKERLEAACNEAYQVLGVMLLVNNGSPKYTYEDGKRMLDNLFAAVNNRPLPHSDILPWPKKL